MSFVDPVKLLRDCFANNKEIKQQGKLLIFPNRTMLELRTPTSWQPPGSDKIYTIGDLWLFLNCKKDSQQNNYYYQKIQEFKKDFEQLQLISYHHQKEIEDYFFGKIQKTKCINPELLEIVQIQKEGKNKKQNKSYLNLIKDKETFEENIKIEDHDYKVMNYIRKFEKQGITSSQKMNLKKNFYFCVEIMENRYDRFNNKNNDKNNKHFFGSKNSILSRILNVPKDNLKRPKPIIIVPDELIQGNLNLGNVNEFLTKNSYKEINSNDEVTKKGFEIYLKILNRKVAFEIQDDIFYLKNRKKLPYVVAIFIKGSPYQFQSIKQTWGYRNIAQLFQNVRGYYMKYKHKKVDNIVNNWNIKVLNIEKGAEHKDYIVFKEFLDDLQQHLVSIVKKQIIQYQNQI